MKQTFCENIYIVAYLCVWFTGDAMWGKEKEDSIDLFIFNMFYLLICICMLDILFCH